MDTSLLTKFPADILNNIAELALGHTEPLKILHFRDSASKLTDFKIMPDKDLNQIEHPAGFILACKELYKNYMSLFYAVNTFTIWTTIITVVSSTKAFLKVVGPKKARAMGTLNIDVALGACRHPRGSTEHLPPVLRDIVTRLERQPKSSLLSDSGVDVESTMASFMYHFKYDDELRTMLNECKTARMKIHYSVAGAGPGRVNEMSFDWHALRTSMEEEAVRLVRRSQAEDGNPLEQLFLVRLGHLVFCYSDVFDDDLETAAESSDAAAESSDAAITAA